MTVGKKTMTVRQNGTTVGEKADDCNGKSRRRYDERERRWVEKPPIVGEKPMTALPKPTTVGKATAPGVQDRR